MKRATKCTSNVPEQDLSDTGFVRFLRSGEGDQRLSSLSPFILLLGVQELDLLYQEFI